MIIRFYSRVIRTAVFISSLVFLVPAIGLAGYGEAPDLAAKAKAGELPPVEERMPDVPMVVQPVDRVGDYGGTWGMGLRGNRDFALILRTLSYENLVRWDPKWTRVIPNVAQSFTANDDYTEYTFTLRKGLRWSDGEPFTADDILFWYEDVLLNKELCPVTPSWLTSGGQVVKVEKLDQYTVVFRFAAPTGLFLHNLAAPQGAEPTAYPLHYLKRFHAKYNPEANDLAKEKGLADWVELFQSEFGLPGNVDEPTRWEHAQVPTLNAWLMTEGYTEDVTQVTAVRNPYYWKIDTAGNQLPYIDELRFRVGADQAALEEMIKQGLIDMQNRHINENSDKAELAKYADQAGFRFFPMVPGRPAKYVVALNLTHKDPVLRQIFQSKDFRAALSLAMDRESIMALQADVESIPFQNAPRPESQFYDQEMGLQFTAFDLELANELLDKAGFNKKDDQGFRLGPDGKRISFTLEHQPAYESMVQILQESWLAIGVEVKLKSQTRAEEYRRKEANEHDAQIVGGEGGLDPLLENQFYLPVKNESIYGMGWYYWYTDPGHKLAVEPPDPIKEQFALYEQLLATGDHEQQKKIMRDILAIAKDQFYVIGTAMQKEGFGIVSRRMGNVPAFIPNAWSYPTPAPTNPCQYFMRP